MRTKLLGALGFLGVFAAATPCPAAEPSCVQRLLASAARVRQGLPVRDAEVVDDSYAAWRTWVHPSGESSLLMYFPGEFLLVRGETAATLNRSSVPPWMRSYMLNPEFRMKAAQATEAFFSKNQELLVLLGSSDFGQNTFQIYSNLPDGPVVLLSSDDLCNQFDCNENDSWFTTQWIDEERLLIAVNQQRFFVAEPFRKVFRELRRRLPDERPAAETPRYDFQAGRQRGLLAASPSHVAWVLGKDSYEVYSPAGAPHGMSQQYDAIEAITFVGPSLLAIQTAIDLHFQTIDPQDAWSVGAPELGFDELRSVTFARAEKKALVVGTVRKRQKVEYRALLYDFQERRVLMNAKLRNQTASDIDTERFAPSPFRVFAVETEFGSKWALFDTHKPGHFGVMEAQVDAASAASLVRLKLGKNQGVGVPVFYNGRKLILEVQETSTNSNGDYFTHVEVTLDDGRDDDDDREDDGATTPPPAPVLTLQ